MKKSFHYLSFTGIILLVLLTTTSANAISVDISPAEEKYVGITGEGNLLGPYSDVDGILVGKIDHLQSGVTFTSIESQGFYEFDISTLSSATENSAFFSFLVPTPPR